MDNQRVRLTKHLLADSLLSLMNEKAFDQISVAELCRKAGINRATFYRYYTDPIDILKEIQSETSSSHALIEQKDIQAAEVLTEILQNTHQNMNRARVLNEITTDGIFSGSISSTESNNDVYYKLLAGTVPEKMREYARFMTSAAMTVWLKNGCDLDEKQFSSLLLNVCRLCQENT